ncbi:MAG: NAD(P)H-dependent oxidoreductase, partial [Pseudomonadales bacterium]
MKVVAFSTSSSRHSSNKKLATYAAGLIEGADVEILDINDFEIPLVSVDREEELGQAGPARAFLDQIASADLLGV